MWSTSFNQLLVIMKQLIHILLFGLALGAWQDGAEVKSYFKQGKPWVLWKRKLLNSLLFVFICELSMFQETLKTWKIYDLWVVQPCIIIKIKDNHHKDSFWWNSTLTCSSINPLTELHKKSSLQKLFLFLVNSLFPFFRYYCYYHNYVDSLYLYVMYFITLTSQQMKNMSLKCQQIIKWQSQHNHCEYFSLGLQNYKTCVLFIALPTNYNSNNSKNNNDKRPRTNKDF